MSEGVETSAQEVVDMIQGYRTGSPPNKTPKKDSVQSNDMETPTREHAENERSGKFLMRAASKEDPLHFIHRIKVQNAVEEEAMEFLNIIRSARPSVSDDVDTQSTQVPLSPDPVSHDTEEPRDTIPLIDPDQLARNALTSALVRQEIAEDSPGIQFEISGSAPMTSQEADQSSHSTKSNGDVNQNKAKKSLWDNIEFIDDSDATDNDETNGNKKFNGNTIDKEEEVLSESDKVQVDLPAISNDNAVDKNMEQFIHSSSEAPNSKVSENITTVEEAEITDINNASNNEHSGQVQADDKPKISEQIAEISDQVTSSLENVDADENKSKIEDIANTEPDSNKSPENEEKSISAETPDATVEEQETVSQIIEEITEKAVSEADKSDDTHNEIETCISSDSTKEDTKASDSIPADVPSEGQIFVEESSSPLQDLNEKTEEAEPTNSDNAIQSSSDIDVNKQADSNKAIVSDVPSLGSIFVEQSDPDELGGGSKTEDNAKSSTKPEEITNVTTGVHDTIENKEQEVIFNTNQVTSDITLVSDVPSPDSIFVEQSDPNELDGDLKTADNATSITKPEETTNVTTGVHDSIETKEQDVVVSTNQMTSDIPSENDIFVEVKDPEVIDKETADETNLKQEESKTTENLPAKPEHTYYKKEEPNENMQQALNDVPSEGQIFVEAKDTAALDSSIKREEQETSFITNVEGVPNPEQEPKQEEIVSTHQVINDIPRENVISVEQNDPQPMERDSKSPESVDSSDDLDCPPPIPMATHPLSSPSHSQDHTMNEALTHDADGTTVTTVLDSYVAISDETSSPTDNTITEKPVINNAPVEVNADTIALVRASDEKLVETEVVPSQEIFPKIDASEAAQVENNMKEVNQLVLNKTTDEDLLETTEVPSHELFPKIDVKEAEQTENNMKEVNQLVLNKTSDEKLVETEEVPSQDLFPKANPVSANQIENVQTTTSVSESSNDEELNKSKAENITVSSPDVLKESLPDELILKDEGHFKLTFEGQPQTSMSAGFTKIEMGPVLAPKTDITEKFEKRREEALQMEVTSPTSLRHESNDVTNHGIDAQDGVNNGVMAKEHAEEDADPTNKDLDFMQTSQSLNIDASKQRAALRHKGSLAGRRKPSRKGIQRPNGEAELSEPKSPSAKDHSSVMNPTTQQTASQLATAPAIQPPSQPAIEQANQTASQPATQQDKQTVDQTDSKSSPAPGSPAAVVMRQKQVEPQQTTDKQVKSDSADANDAPREAPKPAARKPTVNERLSVKLPGMTEAQGTPLKSSKPVPAPRKTAPDQSPNIQPPSADPAMPTSPGLVSMANKSLSPEAEEQDESQLKRLAYLIQSRPPGGEIENKDQSQHEVAQWMKDAERKRKRTSNIYIEHSESLDNDENKDDVDANLPPWMREHKMRKAKQPGPVQVHTHKNIRSVVDSSSLEDIFKAAAANRNSESNRVFETANLNKDSSDSIVENSPPKPRDSYHESVTSPRTKSAGIDIVTSSLQKSNKEILQPIKQTDTSQHHTTQKPTDIKQANEQKKDSASPTNKPSPTKYESYQSEQNENKPPANNGFDKPASKPSVLPPLRAPSKPPMVADKPEQTSGVMMRNKGGMASTYRPLTVDAGMKMWETPSWKKDLVEKQKKRRESLGPVFSEAAKEEPVKEKETEETKEVVIPPWQQELEKKKKRHSFSSPKVGNLGVDPNKSDLPEWMKAVARRRSRLADAGYITKEDEETNTN